MSTEPIWDLYRDGITYSMIKQFLACKQKFKYSNVDAIYLSSSSKNAKMDFGSIFHDNLEHIYIACKNGKISTDPDEIEKYIRARYTRLWDTYVEEYKSCPKGLDDYNDVQRLYTSSEVLTIEYIHHYKSDFTSMKWLGLETVFDIPWTFSSGRTTRLRGKRDGEYSGDSRGVPGVYLFETKTKGTIDTGTLVDTVILDLQLGIYSHAIRQDYQMPCLGAIYNVVRRPRMKPKAKQTILEFRKTLEDHIQGDTDHYFKRIPIRYSESDYRNWMVEFTAMMDEIDMWTQGGPHFRNSGSCTTAYGSCPYLTLCSSGNDDRYKQKDSLFDELKVIE